MSLIVGSFKWLNENKENIDFLYSKSSNHIEKKEEQISTDCDLPDWLNDDYLIENQKEIIKIQLEKKKKILKERKNELEKIKKGVSFVNLDLKLNFKKTNVEDDDLLDYESDKENFDEISQIFNRMKNMKSEDKIKNKEEIEINNFSPLKVTFFFYINFTYIDYLCKSNAFSNQTICPRNKKNRI